MALTQLQIQQVETVLRNSLRYKFQNYKPEPASMPFHTRLLGKDRMALFSFKMKSKQSEKWLKQER